MDSDRFFCRYSELPLGFDRHFHNAHQLLYIVSGEVRVQVGSSVYGGQPGDLFVISRLEEHGTALEKGAYRRYTLQLSREWLDHALEDARLKSLFLRRPSGFCHRLPDESRELEGLFHMMAEEDRVPRPFSGISQSALFCRLMVLCYR